MRLPTTRRGFTLVELLVVIGIILVLTAIIVMGIQHVSNVALRHETQAELKVCQDMLKEYESINGLKNIEESVPPPLDASRKMRLPSAWIMPGNFQLPVFIDTTPDVSGTTTGQPRSVLVLTDFAGSPANHGSPGWFGDFSDKSDFNDPRWASVAVQSTQGIMFILLKDPKNRALVSSMPSKRILESPPAPTNAQGQVNGQKPTSFTIDAATILDGWGNPIIYVPRGGMYVYLKPGSNDLDNYVIRSSGFYPVRGGIPPVGPNDHPFFASAGPDGYFTDFNQQADRAIDNLYSFQEQ